MPLVLNKFDRSLLLGFGEAITFASLRASRHSAPPTDSGVYAVVHPFDAEPAFIAKGSGGWYKGKDSNVAIPELRERWVSESRIIYFGKAGGPDEKTHLRTRISAYSRFGRGTKASHWGGRLIWQIQGSSGLLICWRSTPGEVPHQVEDRLLQQFVAHYCKLPFANLCD